MITVVSTNLTEEVGIRGFELKDKNSIQFRFALELQKIFLKTFQA